jgi:hypothetical protein
MAYFLGWRLRPPRLDAIRILVSVTTACGLIWTGLMLLRGSRAAGYLALGFTVLPLAFAALGGYRLTTTNMVLAVLTLTVLFSVWNELK